MTLQVCCAQYPVKIIIDEKETNETACLCAVAENCDDANSGIDGAKTQFTMKKTFDTGKIVHTQWGDPKDGMCAPASSEGEINEVVQGLCSTPAEAPKAPKTDSWMMRVIQDFFSKIWSI